MEKPRDPNSTPPKLSFSLLPAGKKAEPPGLETPPLRGAPVSVPFRWEEAPGRPRKLQTGLLGPASSPRPGSTRRSLELPPRMVVVAGGPSTKGLGGNGSAGSPTTVLEGPDVPSRPLACYSFAFGEEFRSAKRCVSKEGRDHVMWSWRRGRRGRKGRKLRRDEDNSEMGSGGFFFFEGFSSSNSSSSRSPSSHGDGSGSGDGVGNGGETEDEEGKVTITRITRSKSLSRASSSSYSTSTLWASIFGSLKLLVPWRKDHKY